MGKGSSRRPTDDKKYSDNYDRIFGNKNGKDKSNTKNTEETKRK